MVNTGLSDSIGSWKIIAMPRPRNAAVALRLVRSKLLPSIVAVPEVTLALLASRPISAKATVDFPLPDSPTSPSSSPFWMSSDTSRSACAVPCGRL